MTKQTNKKKKIFLVAIATIVAIILLSFSYFRFSIYHPSESASSIATTATVRNKQVTEFKAKNSKLTVVFYPGALVEPDSYSIWAKKVAQAGYTVKIAHFPMNKAIFEPTIATKLVTRSERYVIGGHSLGGAMAARYVHEHHSANLKGVFFLAAYADEKGRLDKLSVPVLSITASNDGVIKQDKLITGQKYLPKATTFEIIKGGNHAGFGSYGSQKGDHKATISNQKQQQLVADKLISWLTKID